MPPDIFETPSQRSTKMIETSWSLMPELPGRVFHFDLESVTLHADGIEVDGLQGAAK